MENILLLRIFSGNYARTYDYSDCFHQRTSRQEMTIEDSKDGEGSTAKDLTGRALKNQTIGFKVAPIKKM